MKLHTNQLLMALRLILQSVRLQFCQLKVGNNNFCLFFKVEIFDTLQCRKNEGLLTETRYENLEW